MPRQYIVDPIIRGDVHVGTEGEDTSIYVGLMAESGPSRRISFGGSQEFVALILGKRGSGKSHTLGVIVEGLATKKDRTTISHHEKRRAVLLLDPIGNFWTTAHTVSADGPPKVQEQFASLDGWSCVPEDVDVTVFLPAGFKTANDPNFIQEFSVRISDLDAPDLADLLGLNLIKDTQGAALSDAFCTVTEEGWSDEGSFRNPNRQYKIADLIDYLEYLRKNQDKSDHSASTLRALIRSLRSLERQPVFSGTGTPLTQLLKPGKLGVLMLPHRVGHDLRRVITRLLIRRILREREEASQIRQRLDVEKVDEDTRVKLQAELENRIPRSILAIDEAQELLGDEGGEAKKALEDYCLLGRNYGLSLLLATQRPTAGAISPKVRSQVDIYFVHRLLTQDDIEMCRSNLLAVYPREVRADDRTLDFTELVRTLERGQVIIAASHAKGNDAITRIVIGKVRPRVTVHGGEVQ
jgi:uncharacterized protein